MDCFRTLENQKIPMEEILILESGSMPPGGYIADQFQRHVVKTVDAMLKRCIKQFNRSLQEAMETGDFQSVPYICKRTGKEMEYCYFYEHILFLEESFLLDLTKEVKKQTALFWANVISEMERLHKETCHMELEDIIYSLKRINKSGV